MTDDEIRRLAAAVMYEGYLLYPYRPCVKNVRRWTFGTLFPQRHAERRGERLRQSTQVLVEGAEDSRLRVDVGFLQVQERIARSCVARGGAEPPDEEFFTPVPSLEVGDCPVLSWQEGVEQTVSTDFVPLPGLCERPERSSFAKAAARRRDIVRNPSGDVVGDVLRQREMLQGELEISACRTGTGLIRITVGLTNRTPMVDPEDSREAERCGFMGTHLLLKIERGRFLSLTDPPTGREAEAAACTQDGTWPVLVGSPGSTDAVLAAPIILPDYPSLAPESPGDLYDASEIDEILSLRIRTLSDSEKRSVRAVEDRSRALLERTERLSTETLGALHGAWRHRREMT
jgi:hydrogenase maturation protease